MNLLPFLLDILKYTFAGVGVVWIAFYLVKPYLERDEKIQLLEFRKSMSSQTLPLRLQAYERLVLFIERINPANMLIRLNATAYSAHELHSLIMEDIRSEYQHNITQQIYVSSRAWGVVKNLKDDTLAMVGNAVKSLPETATGLELSKAILGFLSQVENNPYDIGTSMMRKDLEELF
ncbi:DUF7935 family protein [Mucilaginibacter gotjawali]|uniref:Uncharacterized protein n=2 Tax=Mucilaginibacter gotjawali TaxID=1550579 RepID=A0A125T200_9SPHI|nr:hypothetical protein [Mucilaginibacter gotjawali]MBB3059051.1 hypothetical protein [Mucilaginibacter gotjawali]BAU52145.1 hypothetical protein MgSA37_00295 [Mucilaginibacter gotjawali]